MGVKPLLNHSWSKKAAMMLMVMMTMMLCCQAIESADRVTKQIKFYGSEYDHETLQQSDTVEESAAKVC